MSVIDPGHFCSIPNSVVGSSPEKFFASQGYGWQYLTESQTVILRKNGYSRQVAYEFIVHAMHDDRMMRQLLHDFEREVRAMKEKEEARYTPMLRPGDTPPPPPIRTGSSRGSTKPPPTNNKQQATNNKILLLCEVT